MVREILSVGLFLALLPGSLVGASEDPSRTEILEAARKIMVASRYCALVTMDNSGAPQVRAMDPFPPNQNMVVRLGTNRSTRKVPQLLQDTRVALYYFDREGMGYVTVSGIARLIEDPDEKSLWWKDEWEPFYEDSFRGDDYIVIEVIPKRYEVVSIEQGMAASPKSWKPAAVVFP